MPIDDNSIIEPEDTNSRPPRNADRADRANEAARLDDTAPRDPNDEIPVPIAMEPAEIDERAKVVEALRERAPRLDEDDSEVRP